MSGVVAPQRLPVANAINAGLKGDGSTNDSAAGQAFLSDAASRGVPAYFPGGGYVYRLSDLWTPTGSDIIIGGATFKIPTSGVTQPDPCHFRLASSDRITGLVQNIRIRGTMYVDHTDVADGLYSDSARAFHLINVLGFDTSDLTLIMTGPQKTAGAAYIIGPNVKGVGPTAGVIGGGRLVGVRGIGCSWAQVLGAKDLRCVGEGYHDGGVWGRNEMDGNPYVSENVHFDGRVSSDGASGFGNTVYYFIPHGNKMRNMSVRCGRATGGVNGVKVAYDTGNTPDSLSKILAERLEVTGGGQLLVSYFDQVPEDWTLRDSMVKGSTTDGVIAIPGNYENVRSDQNAGYGFIQATQGSNLYPEKRRYVFDAACHAESNAGGAGFRLIDAQGKVYFAGRANEPWTGSAGANLLTTNAQGFEGGLGGWQGLDANTTVAQSTTWADAGTHSMSITRTSTTGTAVARSSSGLSGAPVSPGVTYHAFAKIKAGSTVRNCWVSLRWFDSLGAFLSDTAGSSSNDSSGGTVKTIDATPPAGAAYAAVLISIGSCPAGELHYADTTGIQVAAQNAVQTYGISQTGGTTFLAATADLTGNVTGTYTASGGTVSQASAAQVYP